MKPVFLNKGKVAFVDDESFDEISKFTWFESLGYAKRSYYDSYKKVRSIFMHRQIMDARKGQEVDHINRNKLDNQKSNLRFVTRSQNKFNVNPRSDNKSGFVGVSWYSRDKNWLATIQVNGKSKRIGNYKTLVEAAKARQDFFNSLNIFDHA